MICQDLVTTGRYTGSQNGVLRSYNSDLGRIRALHRPRRGDARVARGEGLSERCVEVIQSRFLSSPAQLVGANDLAPRPYKVNQVSARVRHNTS